MAQTTKVIQTILTTTDVIKLIKQDKTLYDRGLENASDNAIILVLKHRFKIRNLSVNMDKIRKELGRKTREVSKDVLLYNAIILLNQAYTLNELSFELGCTVARLKRILKREE